MLYTLLRKGESHTVYCEDFAITYEDNQKIVFAVLDGCSSGKESMFASALIGKVLRKNALQSSLKEIMRHTFADLKQTKKMLALTEDELLATVLLAMYDKQSENAEIIVVGDGFVLIDDRLEEIDQQNTPDYWGYYLEGEFEDWWRKQTIFKAEKPKRLAVSTDGIDTFRTHKMDLPADFMPKDFLLLHEQWANLPTMLTRKCNVLQTQYGYLPYDDVGVVMWRI
jgi:hypothetical protein